MTQATQLIDALNDTFGRHSNYRASHAKGLAVTGRFIPAENEPAVQIPLLQSEQPVAARFSIGGGKPGISDKSPTVRGIGLTIGNKADTWTMALISAPVFFANSAQQFVDFLAARAPDPETGAPDPDKVQAFNAANPNTVPHQGYLKSTAPCRCYSTERFHSGHTYGFSAKRGTLKARLLLEPLAGRNGLTPEEFAVFPNNFLFDALALTLAKAPAQWALKLIVANARDETKDPTVQWVGDHREISLGTIEVDNLDTSNEGQAGVFDPSHLTTGVTAPSDAVFPLRSDAYAESKRRRSS